MSKRRGLGKGLQALIPVKEEALAGKEQLKELKINEIRPAPRNARKLFDQEKLAELASSIKEHGVIQPVVVRPLDDGGYELIAGERRWRACKALGYDKIPAVVKEYKDLEATAVSLIENVQREDLNPLEEAMAYQKLMEDFGLTQEEVSLRVGKSRPFVANMVRLLG
ncbi:MAG: ParB/RepB/Spo0J family partition protein, partial [Firmicutes bacterium]|nr:ParB/RepB/Spo0J family partition protein [Bacillota bacterium]